MISDIRLHGKITDNIDYYAILTGGRLLNTYFYEESGSGESYEIKFFIAGNSIVLNGAGIRVSGNGGMVSEYMFGSKMPLDDLSRKEIRNRLILFGTYEDPETDHLVFTNRVSTEEGMRGIFMDGNAIRNYIFLIQGLPYASARKRQEILLMLSGRTLKRSPYTNSADDSDLALEILKELAEPDVTLLLVRLQNRRHYQFYRFLEGIVTSGVSIGGKQKELISRCSEELGIEPYQRERIFIDTLYKTPQNKKIVDEYKEILLQTADGQLSPSAIARLNSLRNLAIRHDLPFSLFDSLDELLMEKCIRENGEEEPTYLRRTREIFQALFLKSKDPFEAIKDSDIVSLLFCKQEAYKNRDNTFEHILLETGRVIDEMSLESDDMRAFERFSMIVTYFDRYDNSEAVISPLAFMEHATITPEKVRSLYGNIREFEILEMGLSDKLLFKPLLSHLYLLCYGRDKVNALRIGIGKIQSGEKNVVEVADEINTITEKEVFEHRIYSAVRAKLKKVYFNLGNETHKRLLRREIEGELSKGSGRQIEILESQMTTVIMNIQKETYYINQVLPLVRDGKGEEEKEDFILNSGLDRYHIEEIEREMSESVK